VRAAAETFRPNPKLDTERVITELGVGEALASVLDAQGTPTVVQRIFVAPPGSKLGPIEPAERAKLMEASLVKGVYEQAVDRVSAYEVLKQRAEFAAVETEATPATPATKAQPKAAPASRAQSPVEAFASSAMRSLGTQIGRALVRGIMGSLSGGRGR
jgi:hypothetical protein